MTQQLTSAERREGILASWEGCALVEDIAERWGCSVSNVYRVVRLYGPAESKRTERGVELKRAEKFADAVVENYNRGLSIDQISAMLGLAPHEVRAAVYLAIQRGEIKAYKTR